MEFVFQTMDREQWLRMIVKSRLEIENMSDIESVNIRLSKEVVLPRFEPYHMVTLSCLIDLVKQRGAKVQLFVDNSNLMDFIWNEVRIKEYWSESTQPHYNKPLCKHSDLWRIDSQYITNYSYSLFGYFKRVFFKGKDLGGLANGWSELLQNVIDHAKASGNAFSFIRYDEQSQKILIAVCDFGIGIPTSLANQSSDDQDALRKCLKDGVSSNSNSHNKGLGLSDVESLVTKNEILRIVSGRAMLYKSEGKIKTYPLDFQFRGTLIYLSIDINSFYDEEQLEEFTL